MSRNDVLCDQPAGQVNDFELIPTTSMESQHSVDGPTSRDFSSVNMVRELSPDEVGSRAGGSGFLEKNDPLREDFENFAPEGFSTSQNHVLCANFVKFG